MKKWALALIPAICLSISVPAITSAETDKWSTDTGKKFAKAFMKGCNAKNDPKFEKFCKCALTKIKKKYPDPAKTPTKLSDKIMDKIVESCKQHLQ